MKHNPTTDLSEPLRKLSLTTMAQHYESMAQEAARKGDFRVLGGYKFLELGPREADKGNSLEFLLAEFPMPGALLLFVGDEDKDEEAFEVIIEHGGIAVRVAPQECETLAHCRLDAPPVVRRWLEAALESVGSPGPG